ncbi:hypothetical protein BCV69DRAFT_295783 [Microstroma glucosiphilum]|uniref:Uncharacterized protein n=1 Tax=Pseudomicrostroma glucosiphilum TaxID=1684307 RepID=A0A316U428_9BASI|nr:hypothetical protein BCV69DRAFT_295783 [Pseudomicrostroma glucosiphilum]PWN17675.1 hypothetical protein BCV69DRAFT_295783 [Pseudomicrostroma glucosiphilum]
MATTFPRPLPLRSWGYPVDVPNDSDAERWCSEADCERILVQFVFVAKCNVRTARTGTGDLVKGLTEMIRKTCAALSMSTMAVLRWARLGTLPEIVECTRCWRCRCCFCQKHAVGYVTLILDEAQGRRVKGKIESGRRPSAGAETFDKGEDTDQHQRRGNRVRYPLPSARAALQRCHSSHQEPTSLCQRLLKLFHLELGTRPCTQTSTCTYTRESLDLSVGTLCYFAPVDDDEAVSFSSPGDRVGPQSSQLARSSASSVFQKLFGAFGMPTIVSHENKRLVILPDECLVVRERVCRNCERIVLAVKAREMARWQQWAREQKSRRKNMAEGQKATEARMVARLEDRTRVEVKEEDVLQVLQTALAHISYSAASLPSKTEATLSQWSYNGAQTAGLSSEEHSSGAGPETASVSVSSYGPSTQSDAELTGRATTPSTGTKRSPMSLHPQLAAETKRSHKQRTKQESQAWTRPQSSKGGRRGRGYCFTTEH